MCKELITITNQVVVLYSIGCPKCGVLERKLNEANITYSLNTDVRKMRDLGIDAVPVLSVDGKLLQFSDAVDWIKGMGVDNGVEEMIGSGCATCSIASSEDDNV